MESSVLLPPLCAAVAGCSAEVCTTPLEVMKVRMQVAVVGAPHSIKSVVASVFESHGIQGFWMGLRPALTRQVLCSGTKFSVYEPFKRATYRMTDTPYTNKPQLWQMLLAGGGSGALMGLVGNPADLVKTRMQSGRMTCGGSAYNTMYGAFSTIVKTEGVLSLWRGVVPMVQRSVLVTMAELAVYDKSKQKISELNLLPAGAPTHAASSFMAGFVAAMVATPIDLAKNRIMTDSLKPPEARMYTGMMSVLARTVREEGYRSLYKGFTPTWLRIGPWAVIMFMTYEQLMTLATGGSIPR